MRNSIFIFALLTLICTTTSRAQISLSFDLNDLKSKEMEASYTTGIGTKQIIWTTNALPMPSVSKHSDACASIPAYMDGAICYRVCGGGLASVPVSWTYEWRPSNRGHETPWEACDGDGCRGFSEEFYAASARGCGHFMIWRALSHDRDLRIKVQLQ